MYKLYAFFDLDQLNNKTLEWCMRYLPEERKAKVLRYRREIDRKLSVASYLLLIHALYQEFNLSVPAISYTEKGKPYLPDHPDIHFNISHCPLGCVCAVSDKSIGVDIQDIRSFSQDIVNRCCSTKELLLLEQSADPAAEFTKIWTAKESYLKMTGSGIAVDLCAVDTTKLRDKIKTFTINDCYISVATAESFQEEEICLI